MPNEIRPATIDDMVELLKEKNAWIEELEKMVRMARVFAQAYALRNPKHEHRGVSQDPCGVHEWLERYDKLKEAPDA